MVHPCSSCGKVCCGGSDGDVCRVPLWILLEVSINNLL